MRDLVEILRSKYKVDGEGKYPKYVEYFESEKDVRDNMDIEIFEETFNVKIDDVNFPVITMDSAGAVDGWLFDRFTSKEKILDMADNFFEKK